MTRIACDRIFIFAPFFVYRNINDLNSTADRCGPSSAFSWSTLNSPGGLIQMCKMHGVFALIVSVTVLVSAESVFAQSEQALVPSDQTEATSSTEISASRPTGGGLENEKFAVTPELGVFSYSTLLNGTQTRGMIGFGLDMNAVTTFVPPEKRNDIWSSIYIGPQTGLFYAHTGSATSNFLGTSPTVADTSAGGNLLLLPLDLKVGYSLADNFRISLHGGGNIIYQSVAGTVNFTRGTTVVGTTAAATNWNIYPNVGGDIEYGVGKNISVLIRPDVTLAPGASPFTGTIGVGIAIG
jgi:hypothetical protein